MPERILRPGILTSDRVNKLGWQAEVFYRRLMSVVDDYGRYDGRCSILRAALYPLKLSSVSEADIGKWMRETAEAGLVSLYSVEGKPFVELSDFRQRLRAAKSKYPPPHDNVMQMTASCGQSHDNAIGDGDGDGDGDEYYCSEPPKAADSEQDAETGFKFAIRGKPGKTETWTLTQKQYESLESAFEGLAIDAELKKAAAWCETNRAKRKTVSGMPRFLFKWLERANNDGRLQNRNGAASGLAPIQRPRIPEPGSEELLNWRP